MTVRSSPSQDAIFCWLALDRQCPIQSIRAAVRYQLRLCGAGDNPRTFSPFPGVEPTISRKW